MSLASPRLHSLAASLGSFTLITRSPRRPRASYPSCVAVYPRDSRSHVFYVAGAPAASIDALAPARLSRRGDLNRPSRSFPRLGSLAASLAALPSMSLIPFVPLYLAYSRSLDRYCHSQSQCPASWVRS